MPCIWKKARVPSRMTRHGQIFISLWPSASARNVSFELISQQKAHTYHISPYWPVSFSWVSVTIIRTIFQVLIIYIREEMFLVTSLMNEKKKKQVALARENKLFLCELYRFQNHSVLKFWEQCQKPSTASTDLPKPVPEKKVNFSESSKSDSSFPTNGWLEQYWKKTVVVRCSIWGQKCFLWKVCQVFQKQIVGEKIP